MLWEQGKLTDDLRWGRGGALEEEGRFIFGSFTLPSTMKGVVVEMRGGESRRGL